MKLSLPCQNRLLLSEDIRSCTVDVAPAAASPNSTFGPGKSTRMVAAGSVWVSSTTRPVSLVASTNAGSATAISNILPM